MSPRRGLVLAALAILVTSGCLALGDEARTADERPADDEPSEAALRIANATTAKADCPSFRGVECFEPSLAVDDRGRIFATNTPCETIARSTDDGRTFEQIPVPPRPTEAPPGTSRGDCTLNVGPDGQLYFSALAQLRMPRGQSAAGIQVAVSTDGGETWTTNTWVHPASRDANLNTHTDRQWLTVGTDGRLWLTYWQYRTGQAWIAVSDDGGGSFEPFRPSPGIIPGDPARTDASTVHIPWVEYPYADANGDEDRPDAIQLSTTSDGGRSFTTTTVAEDDEGVYGPWYDVDTAHDLLYAAWIDKEGHLHVTRGTPEDGFAAPVTVNADEASADPNIPPAIVAHEGNVTLTWYRQTDTGQRHVLADGPAELNASRFTIHSLGTIASQEETTDFSTLALGPDGARVPAWTNPDTGLQVTLATRR